MDVPAETSETSGSDATALEPLDPQLTDIQPGGGVVIGIEKAWGSVRRWYLKTFRRGYVARMAELRRGDRNPAPHDVLDPRDVKYYENQPGGYYWDKADDPFQWRERIPFAREGLAELFLMAGGFFAIAAACGFAATRVEPTWATILLWVLCLAGVVVGGLIVWFFRDPHRTVPTESDLVISPADGTVADIYELEHDDFIGGPAVVVGVFLSIFNVHINRSPIAARVIGLQYRPGKCLNALRPESARENERLSIRIEGSDAPRRRMIVVQITGAIARRIVCRAKPGDVLERGQKFGMIKLGSRTELVMPKQDLQVLVRVGEKIKAGSTRIATYSGNPQTGSADTAGDKS